MNSVPLEIIELDMDFSDYAEIARNVGRVREMRDSWDEIFSRANKEIPKEVSDIALKLPTAMAYDREFCGWAGVSYVDGDTFGFTVAVADYLLRRRPWEK